ncbi:hypothetical protein Tco_1162324 [Tanacetum coccineum]
MLFVVQVWGFRPDVAVIDEGFMLSKCRFCSPGRRKKVRTRCSSQAPEVHFVAENTRVNNAKPEGICCIDGFDKISENARSMLHEVEIEQIKLMGKGKRERETGLLPLCMITEYLRSICQSYSLKDISSIFDGCPRMKAQEQDESNATLPLKLHIGMVEVLQREHGIKSYVRKLKKRIERNMKNALTTKEEMVKEANAKIGTDNAKIARKRSKLDKHGHGNG